MEASCAGSYSSDGTEVVRPGTAPSGLSPANLQDAYGFQSLSSGMRQTVAIVTAYDDQTAESDMATYRQQFGIPACTTANGCFSKVSQTGTTAYPQEGTADWIATDTDSLDMISAICPNCHILMVEATRPDITDLGTAENEAVTLGADNVNNTWITPETSSDTTYDSDYFHHPGVEITAPDSSTAYPSTSYPAASQYVTAVGGTSLATTSNYRGWTESAWDETGSGCSTANEPKPSWQTDTGCSWRTLNDVSADADTSNSPVAVYLTLPGASGGSWGTSGGDAVAAAIIAGAYALAGTPAANSSPASYPYANTGLLNDITTGSNGSCGGSYLCAAGPGYDGPTGLGTPASSIPFTATGASPAAEITSGIAGDCLDNNEAKSPPNKVDIYPCNDGAGAQNWTVQADGTIRIGSSYCLDNHQSGKGAGNPVDLAACNGTGAQQWHPRYSGIEIGTTGVDMPGIELVNPETNMCLEAPSATNGTQLVIEPCTSPADGSQNWAEPYSTPTSTGEIVSQVPGSIQLCVDNHDGKLVNGNPVNVYNCNGGTDSQNWTVAADGTIQIGNGYCLDVYHSGTGYDTPVDLNACNNTGAQQWVARSDETLVNPESGLCLNDPDGDNPGSQLNIAKCNTTQAQEWALPS